MQFTRLQNHRRDAASPDTLFIPTPSVLFTTSKSKNVAIFYALRAAVASFSVPTTHFQKLDSSRKTVNGISALFSPTFGKEIAAPVQVKLRVSAILLKPQASDKVSNKVTISSVCLNSASLPYYLETRADPANKC